MVKLGTVLDFLDTYRGRDKVLRTLCYGSKCMAGLSSNPELAGRLDNFSGTLSSCRATLRLLDDIPMLAYTAEYGLGDKEKDDYLRYTNILSNVIDLLFYPVDHISWAIDHGVISSKDSKWGTISTVCWAASLYLTIAKSMRGLHILAEEKLHMPNTDENRENFLKIKKKQRDLIIAALRASSDVIFAIHYLPKGYLWAGALKKWHVGALGTFSSVLGLYQAFS